MYESPVTLYEFPSYVETVNQINDAMDAQKDEQIMNVIRQTIDIKIDRNELMKALQYDRDQYNKGYQDGYEKGKNEAVKVNTEKVNNLIHNIKDTIESTSREGVCTLHVNDLLSIYRALIDIKLVCEGKG